MATHKNDNKINKRISFTFRQNDFACKCGNCNNKFKFSLTLLGVLEYLVGRFKGNKILIQQAYLCPEKAEKIYGNMKEYFSIGKAVIISIENTSAAEVFKEAEKLNELKGIGLINSDNLLHLDVGEKERILWVLENNEKMELTEIKRIKYELVNS